MELGSNGRAGIISTVLSGKGVFLISKSPDYSKYLKGVFHLFPTLLFSFQMLGFILKVSLSEQEHHFYLHWDNALGPDPGRC